MSTVQSIAAVGSGLGGGVTLGAMAAAVWAFALTPAVEAWRRRVRYAGRHAA